MAVTIVVGFILWVYGAVTSAWNWERWMAYYGLGTWWHWPLLVAWYANLFGLGFHGLGETLNPSDADDSLGYRFFMGLMTLLGFLVVLYTLVAPGFGWPTPWWGGLGAS